MARKISFCAIVKNEAQSLPQCLQSVRLVVDEMVVVDTGSTDNTVAIAKDSGAKVYPFQWTGNYSEARNYGLQKATGDWVLVLDADEILTAEIVPQIHQALKNQDYLVVNLLRQEVGAVQSPYSLVSRLFRRHPEIKFSRPYHTLIDDSVTQLIEKEPHWKIVTLAPIAILHYGYQPETITALDKTTRARKAMESYLEEYPGDPYVGAKLGALYIQLGEIEMGQELLEKGLEAPHIDAPLRFELHYQLGNLYTHLADPYAAASHYQGAIEEDILPILKLGAYNNLGNLFQVVGDLDNAQKAYNLALEIDPSFALGYYNLGMTLKELGRFREATQAYNQAIKYNPGNAQAHQNLGVVFWKMGKLPESISAFRRAIALHKTQNPGEAQRLSNFLVKMGIRI